MVFGKVKWNARNLGNVMQMEGMTLGNNQEVWFVSRDENQLFCLDSNNGVLKLKGILQSERKHFTPFLYNKAVIAGNKIFCISAKAEDIAVYDTFENRIGHIGIKKSGNFRTGLVYRESLYVFPGTSSEVLQIDYHKEKVIRTIPIRISDNLINFNNMYVLCGDYVYIAIVGKPHIFQFSLSNNTYKEITVNEIHSELSAMYKIDDNYLLLVDTNGYITIWNRINQNMERQTHSEIKKKINEVSDSECVRYKEYVLIFYVGTTYIDIYNVNTNKIVSKNIYVCTYRIVQVSEKKVLIKDMQHDRARFYLFDVEQITIDNIYDFTEEHYAFVRKMIKDKAYTSEMCLNEKRSVSLTWFLNSFLK